MLSVEGMNDMVLVSINLIINIYGLLNEFDELLHLLAEKLLDVVCKLIPELFDPLEAGSLLALTAALWTVVPPRHGR